MIIIDKIFETREDKIAYCIEHKKELVEKAKKTIKQADSYGIVYFASKPKKSEAEKSNSNNTIEEEYVDVLAVINTTKILDSHDDVHIDGLWKKTLKESKRLKHLQEHKSREFQYIISDGEDLEASTKDFAWSELGFDKEGSTQGLVFKSRVWKARNPFMYNQYKNGWVTNHSVGMGYVSLEFGANPDIYKDEEANQVWSKYINEIANKDEAEQRGMFWAVTEAKLYEGSSVPDGSNAITPTLEVKGFNKKEEIEDKNKMAVKSFLGIK